MMEHGLELNHTHRLQLGISVDSRFDGEYDDYVGKYILRDLFFKGIDNWWCTPVIPALGRQTQGD
jgi:hypothetical protein